MFGVGCSAFSSQGIEKILNFKKRDSNKGLIVLIADISDLEKFEVKLNDTQYQIINELWPDNLTICLPAKDIKNVSQDGLIAFRIPKDDFLKNFMREINSPIISTSINISGEPYCKSLDEVEKKFDNWFEIAFLPSKIEKKEIIPSTVIKFISENKISILREGEVKKEKLGGLLC